MIESIIVHALAATGLLALGYVAGVGVGTLYIKWTVRQENDNNEHE